MRLVGWDRVFRPICGFGVGANIALTAILAVAVFAAIAGVDCLRRWLVRRANLTNR